MVLSHFASIRINLQLTFVHLYSASGIQYTWEYYFNQLKNGLSWLDTPIPYDIPSTVNWVAWSRKNAYMKKPFLHCHIIYFINQNLI